jgi:hypothetical protein
MRRKTLLVLASVSLAASIAVSPAGSAPAITAPTTLRFVEDFDHFRLHFVDAPPLDRYNTGDVVLTRSRLLDEHGNRVGFYQDVCIAQIPSVAREDLLRVSPRCEGTIMLENGSIEFAGQFTILDIPTRMVSGPLSFVPRSETEGFHFAVTGGTDAYRGVGGQVRPGGQGAFTIRLVP